MIDQLQSTCHKAYFLPKHSKNLANTISIVEILYLVILISMIAIQFVLTKRNIENEVFAQIADNKERKRLFIEILVAISIMTLMIVLIIVYIKYSTQLLIIVSIFVVALITYSYYHYVRISDQQHLGNINIVVETHQKVRTRIGTIIIQLIIQVIVEILEILLNITDILQMLQYMKFQYYQNRITNISWLINPANVILKTAQSLGKLIRKPEEPLNMNMFLLMKLLKLFQYIFKASLITFSSRSLTNRLNSHNLLTKTQTTISRSQSSSFWRELFIQFPSTTCFWSTTSRSTRPSSRCSSRWPRSKRISSRSQVLRLEQSRTS
ncbi:Hypothetical_protein [Hexamita inflata]|uniref:Hypothetical_protein n=1 Tax=Hexamita inflata TaxID=28002 RepID=A0AA86VNN3_9EUKA|nr:Hypothetical protein HINF_LOCUS59208 [Hexamita inflata]